MGPAADLTADFREETRRYKRNEGRPIDNSLIMQSIDREKPQKSITPFMEEAQALLKNVMTMQQFLMEHIHDYVNADRFIASKASTMTDDERDRIDEEATLFTQSCEARINILKTLIRDVSSIKEGTRTAHEHGIILYLLERLKVVTGMIEQQRAARLRQMIAEREKFSSAKASDLDASSFQSFEKEDGQNGSHRHMSPVNVEEFYPELDITQEEEEQFSQENMLLESQFENDLEEVRQMERKMLEISSLMSTFTDKVVEQQKEIEQLYENAVQSKSNITQGNVHLQKAMEHGDSFFKFLVTFIFTASAVLLFLDWYA